MVFAAAGGDLNNSLLGNNDTKTTTDDENESVTNNLNSIHNNRNTNGSSINLSQFADMWRKMCHSNHDEASQFFYVVTKAADATSNFSTPTTDNSDSTSLNTFSYLSKASSDFPHSNTSSTKQPIQLTSSNFGGNSSSNNHFNNNNINSKRLNSGTKSARAYVVPEDLVILIQDVVDSHPGLGFLKEATEFHSRYVHTVS